MKKTTVVTDVVTASVNNGLSCYPRDQNREPGPGPKLRTGPGSKPRTKPEPELKSGNDIGINGNAKSSPPNTSSNIIQLRLQPQGSTVCGLVENGAASTVSEVKGQSYFRSNRRALRPPAPERLPRARRHYPALDLGDVVAFGPQPHGSAVGATAYGKKLVLNIGIVGERPKIKLTPFGGELTICNL
ncbi:hypothetical protein EVAR_44583_1 [Eumeta japonica]|uniref:Uncharacterized protein n=1 Tax=Eumeta variegata TaxID=151549 RepID=A0A4C1XC61_EUMVA|nr:hypothetical protein EVAR_44583_1 [Eumeta japonica]